MRRYSHIMKPVRHFHFFSFFLFCVAFFSINVSARTLKHLEILVTSDLHGWLSTSDIYPTHKKKGLLHIQDWILDQKSTNNNLILIDGGDLLYGSPHSFYCRRLQGCTGENNPFFKVFNELGYDAVVVGNHDLDFTPLWSSEYLKQARFNWLSANIFRNGIPLFKPYVNLNRENVNVVIAGFTTPGILMWQEQVRLNRIEVLDLTEAVGNCLDIIEKKEQPDLLIGVFHAGLNAFRGNENSKLNRIPPSNDLRAVIKRFPQFDLVISGHDHYLNPRYTGRKVQYISGTPVISGGRWGEAVIKVRIELEDSGSERHVSLIRTETFHARQRGATNEEFRNMTGEDYFTYLNEKLPWLVDSSSNKKASECINKLIAISHSDKLPDATLFPVIRVSGLAGRKGKMLSRADLFRWIRYDNRPVTLRMSARDLFLLTHPNPEFGYRRLAYNRKLYLWSRDQLVPQRSSSFWLEGSQFDRIYSVAISDYHFHGGGGIVRQVFLSEKDVLSRSDFYLRDSLFAYLKKQKSLPDECGFLKFSPLP